MKWFSHKNAKPSAPGEDPGAQLQRSGDVRRSIVAILQALLATVKGCFFDEKDPESEKFLKAIDHLSAALPAAEDPEEITALFEASHGIIASFVQRQRAVAREKENEYKDIIAILTKAMADMNVGNQAFGETIFEKSEKMERITLLEDIREIKTAIQQESASIKAAVQEKQSQDDQMIGRLSEQVTTLKSELEISQQVSLRDGLTGLYNEQALNRYLKTLIGPGVAPRSAFSMLVIDIDRFEKIEKTYGAAIGQRVIMAAAQECRNTYHREEFVARYQRGTFVVVLPRATRKQAVRSAKDLCRAVAAKRYRIDEELAEHTLGFTVSIGVSSGNHRDTVAAITGRAVQALFAARRSGPNRVASDKTLFMRFKKKGEETLADL